MTQQLYLAANLVPETVIYGHLQIVYEDAAGNLVENETTSPGFPYFFGDWAFPDFGRAHDNTTNTPGYGNPNDYAIVSLDLRAGQTAEHVWELMGQIHASLSSGNHGLDYDIRQNSNSYAASVLSVVGIDIAAYLSDVTPPDIEGFPGVGTDIFHGAKTGGLFSGYDTPIPLTLAGTSGNDYIVTGIGKDDLSGAAGDDEIHAGGGNDVLDGGSGADILHGDSGNDVLHGGTGNDTLHGGPGADLLDGGDGNDTVSYAGSATGVGARLDGLVGWEGAAGDIISSVENMVGSAHKDTMVGSGSANLLQGGGGDDTIFALAGDDTVEGGAGADTIYGQGGNDTVSYAGSARGVGVRLDGTVGWGGAAGDTIFTVENLIGSAHRDTLVGSGQANLIDAGCGNDRVFAGAGNDTIVGGDGDDQIHGQAGQDTLIFEDGFGTDTVFRFSANDAEQIDLTGVTGITSFADLLASHLQTDAGSGFALIVDGSNSILLDGITVAQIGLGLAYSENDFLF